MHNLDLRTIDVEYVTFNSRHDRTKYIAERFQQFLHGRVLDVGCDRSFLKVLVPDIRHVGVDISGEPDIILNLERVCHLPFADATFDCVVCSDVLEHLDNLHNVFGELVRTAKSYLIISLPNNWANARRPIERGKGTIGHYGLPADPPPDRHKWFFNLSEALRFVGAQVERYRLRVADVCVNEKPRPPVVRSLRRLRFGSKQRYLDRYAHSLWIVLEKDHSSV